VELCSDPAGAPALPAPSPAVRVFFSGLRIYEAIGVTSTCLESSSQSTPPTQSFGRAERALTDALHLSAAQPK